MVQKTANEAKQEFGLQRIFQGENVAEVSDRGELKTLGGNFLLAIAAGLVEGVVAQGILSTNPAVGSTFEDIWDAGGNFVYATTGETLELVSDSAADDSAGTGLRTIRVEGLNTDYEEISEIVTLDGTAAVTLSNSYFRTRIMRALTVGSGSENAGNITLRVSGGGNTRLLMRATQGVTFSSHFTVPTGKTLFVLGAAAFIPKNEDVTIKTRGRFGSNTAPIGTGLELSVYQNHYIFPNLTIPFFPEKSDLFVQAKSTNAAVSVSHVIEALLTDNVTSGYSKLADPEIMP